MIDIVCFTEKMSRYEGADEFIREVRPEKAKPDDKRAPNAYLVKNSTLLFGMEVFLIYYFEHQAKPN